MANPQSENGHIDIANEIVDALAAIRISGEEMQCLWVILRKTYGWKKKFDWIALSQFEGMTGIKRPNIVRALSKLIDKNIVIKKDNGIKISYGFQKDYKIWKPLSKKITLSKKIKDVIKKDNLPLSKKIPTKDTTTKDIYTKEQQVELFHDIWKRYPNKDSRGKSEKSFNKAIITEDLFTDINKALDNYLDMLKLETWRKPQSGSTWFNNWQDWIDYESPISESKDFEIIIDGESQFLTKSEYTQWKIDNGR